MSRAHRGTDPSATGYGRKRRSLARHNVPVVDPLARPRARPCAPRLGRWRRPRRMAGTSERKRQQHHVARFGEVGGPTPTDTTAALTAITIRISSCIVSRRKRASNSFLVGTRHRVQGCRPSGPARRVRPPLGIQADAPTFSRLVSGLLRPTCVRDAPSTAQGPRRRLAALYVGFQLACSSGIIHEPVALS